jgi:hypothetical protein
MASKDTKEVEEEKPTQPLDEEDINLLKSYVSFAVFTRGSEFPRQ